MHHKDRFEVSQMKLFKKTIFLFFEQKGANNNDSQHLLQLELKKRLHNLLFRELKSDCQKIDKTFEIEAGFESVAWI